MTPADLRAIASPDDATERARLEREMRLMKWRPEYRVIALNTLIARAQELRDAAAKEIKE